MRQETRLSELEKQHNRQSVSSSNTGKEAGSTIEVGSLLPLSIRTYGSNEFRSERSAGADLNPYPTAFPYGNGMVLHFYQQKDSSTTKTVHKVINYGLKAYV